MSDKLKLTIGIVRISVEEGADDRAQLLRHLNGLSDAGASELFYDVASRTAGLSDRPGLTEALKLIESGEVARVLIPDVERLTASQTLLEAVISTCLRYDVELIPLNLGFNITTATGKLLATIAAAGAEFELSRIRGRHKRSTGYEKEHEIWRGGARFGFRVRNGKLEPDTQPFLCLLSDPEGTRHGISKAQIAIHQIELFEKLKGGNRTVAAIHEHYGILLPTQPPDRPTLKNRLTPEEVEQFKKRRYWQISLFCWSVSGFMDWIADPVICGDRVKTKQVIEYEGKDKKKRILSKDQWEIVRNSHTGLISRERHQEILRIIEDNHSSPKGDGSYAANNLYSGKVFCGQCGSLCRMTGNGNHHRNKKFLYQCILYGKERARLRQNPSAQIACMNKTMVRLEKINEAVLAFLVERASYIDQKRKIDSAFIEEPESLEVIELRNQIKQYEALNDADLRPVLEAKRAKLDRLLFQKSEAVKTQKANDAMIVSAFQDTDFWNYIPLDEKRETIARLIDKITILNGEVTSIALR